MPSCTVTSKGRCDALLEPRTLAKYAVSTAFPVQFTDPSVEKFLNSLLGGGGIEAPSGTPLIAQPPCQGPWAAPRSSCSHSLCEAQGNCWVLGLQSLDVTPTEPSILL